ncbi:MAG: tRNA 4-thiouridine(8) synthase ThiI [Planctomycetota bacterium]|nr:MAG: tRNA 4-thiouridine(8) synthase ThiI [Planctomycetota bacterium]
MSGIPLANKSGALIVRYHEIALKGGNRPMFEKRLERNLRAALKSFDGVQVRRIRGRMLVQADGSPARLEEAAARVFGLANLSTAWEVEPDLEAIAATGRELVEHALTHQYAGLKEVPFRVTVNRAAKSFPHTSVECDRAIGDLVVPHFPRLRVNLKAPILELEVDIRDEGTWVFSGRHPGPGGLPVGVMGRVMCLLSGGIDSPVASWLAMKRGMRVDFVSFYSYPHVGPRTRDKIIRQVENLSRWQPQATLNIVPFAAIQEAIRDNCPPSYRTVLYRRAMQRIATKLAFRSKCKALITGESVGQVASQTLENIRVIEEASGLPVLRPLVTFDKQEAIDIARRIGTFETSNLPAPDCCTVFQPEHPILYGKLEEALAAEAALDINQLTIDAVRANERLHIPELK